MTSFRSIITSTFVVVGVISFASPVPAATGYSFQGLGDLPGGAFDSWAHGLSADGSTVVGESVVGDRNQAFRWTREGGIESLGAYPGGDSYSIAWDASADGSTIVGQARVGGLWRAFRWTAPTGMSTLPPIGTLNLTEARAISDDSTTIGGISSSPLGIEPTLWGEGAAPYGLGHAPIGQTNGYLIDLSADGKVAVGEIGVGLGYQAFRWTAETGNVSLGKLLPNQTVSDAQAVSADGKVVVGASQTATSMHAFRWTDETGMVAIGSLSPAESTTALGVSADGSVIVGQGDGAFIWTEQSGMLDLRQVLLDAGLADVQGWYFYGAEGISADGRTIIGTGINPQGQREAWIATIPEPSAGLLAAVGIVVVFSFRCRVRS